MPCTCARGVKNTRKTERGAEQVPAGTTVCAAPVASWSFLERLAEVCVLLFGLGPVGVIVK